MFFGRKPEPEKVPIPGLMPMLNQLFDKKLERFQRAVLAMPKELRSFKLDFERACDEFEKLDVQPYTEDLWNPNINSIKGQKTAYAVALKNVMGKMSLEIDGMPNVYSKYKLLFLNIEETLNAIQKHNTNFKIIRYCYSDHLKSFKRSSMGIEQIRLTLKNELDIRQEDYNSYNVIAEQISRLEAYVDQIASLHDGIEILERNMVSSDNGEAEKEEYELSKKIESKQLEISEARQKISEISNKINLLTAPLDRASKKFDHQSGSKRQLNRFVVNPLGTILTEQEHKEFTELIGELKSAIESGSVDLKNKSEVLSVISRLSNSEIYSEIGALNSAKTRIADLESEARELERAQDAIKAGTNSKAQALTQIEKMRAEIKKAQDAQESLKSSIAKSFLDNYSKLITIALD